MMQTTLSRLQDLEERYELACKSDKAHHERCEKLEKALETAVQQRNICLNGLLNHISPQVRNAWRKQPFDDEIKKILARPSGSASE